MTTSSIDTDILTEDLVAFIEEAVSAGYEPVEAGTDLMMTGLVDSLGVVLIVDWLEERLAIKIDPADVVLENFISVKAMIAYIASRSDVPAQ